MGTVENLIYKKTYWECKKAIKLVRKKKTMLTHFLSRSDKLHAQAFLLEVE